MQKLTFDDPVAKTLSPQMCDSLARRVQTEIDAWCVDKYQSEHRDHLGASLIGKNCSREIWYSFRWMKASVFNGRMLRLFQTGNLQEARIIEYLRGIGFTVWDIDPNTGKQFRIYGASYHYGGSADSVGTTPYPELIGLNLLIEFKTHNTKQFSKLCDHGLMIGKPEHYAQMCAYGVHFGMRYGMYIAVNKNDDDIRIFVVPIDATLAIDLSKKAEDIIGSQIPPPKISLQSTYYECKYCPMIRICHFNETPDKNCRSCTHAEPAENAQWGCNLFQQLIPPDFIPKGCDKWQPIA